MSTTEKPWYFWDAVSQVQKGSGPWLEMMDSTRELSLSRYCSSEEDLKFLGLWPYGTRLIQTNPRKSEVYRRYCDPEKLLFCYTI